jgi:hypothetical protein
MVVKPREGLSLCAKTKISPRFVDSGSGGWEEAGPDQIRVFGAVDLIRCDGLNFHQPVVVLRRYAPASDSDSSLGSGAPLSLA